MQVRLNHPPRAMESHSYNGLRSTNGGFLALMRTQHSEALSTLAMRHIVRAPNLIEERNDGKSHPLFITFNNCVRFM